MLVELREELLCECARILVFFQLQEDVDEADIVQSHLVWNVFDPRQLFMEEVVGFSEFAIQEVGTQGTKFNGHAQVQLLLISRGFLVLGRCNQLCCAFPVDWLCRHLESSTVLHFLVRLLESERVFFKYVAGLVESACVTLFKRQRLSILFNVFELTRVREVGSFVFNLIVLERGFNLSIVCLCHRISLRVSLVAFCECRPCILLLK